MTRNEKIAELKKMYEELPNTDFSVEDNCEGDGWTGCLEENGARCYGDDQYEGDFFKYEDMDDDLLDTLLYEAEFDDEIIYED